LSSFTLIFFPFPERGKITKKKEKGGKKKKKERKKKVGKEQPLF
jgi:hypothetical protein